MRFANNYIHVHVLGKSVDSELCTFLPDADITIDEYLKHSLKRRHNVDDVNDLCPTVRMQLLREFSLMDQDGDGKLDWWEFVNNESKYYLAKKDKVNFYVNNRDYHLK